METTYSYALYYGIIAGIVAGLFHWVTSGY
jgi:hypothetical protein